VDDKFLVQVITGDGSPGRTFGPYGTYVEAEAILRAALIAGQNQNGPVEITPEVSEAISENGFWTFDDGWGGIYIVQAEEYSEDDEDDDDDEEEHVGYFVEDDTLYHTMYPDDSLGEFQDGRFVPSRFLLELPADCHRLADEWATNYIGEQQDS